MIRLFAALMPPDDVVGRLEDLQTGLPGRHVDAENLHVTLRFFGEVNRRVAEDLDAALGAIRAAPFELWFDGCGSFGKSRPRLIHAAVRPEPALTALQAKVVSAGRAAGIDLPAERYAPHATLARFGKGEVSAQTCARLMAARAAFLAGPARIEAFHLFRSELGRHGPTYTALADYPLA